MRNYDENNLMKIILIFKLLNSYYDYRKKIYKKSVEYRKRQKNNINKSVSTDYPDEYVQNNYKEVESYNSAYKLYTDGDKADRNNKVEKLELEVPIIISEKNISIPLEYNIELKDYIMKVNRIKNQVYLTDSKLFPLILPNNKVNLSQGKLFIEGIVRSTIEYNTVDNLNDNSLSGYTKHTTSFIPFNCTTFVSYSHLPIIESNNTKDKIDCFLKKSELFISNSYFNGKIISTPYNLEKIYKGVHQKLVLKLTITLTQRQLITIIKEDNKL